MKKITLFVLAVGTLFASCKKETKDTSTTPFNTIAEKRWQMTSYMYNQIGVDVERITVVDTCVADDYWTLKSDFTNMIDEGKINCSGSQTRTLGTWVLLNNSTQLQITKYDIAKLGLSDATYNILELSPTKLKIQRTTAGIVYTFTYAAK